MVITIVIFTQQTLILSSEITHKRLKLGYVNVRLGIGFFFLILMNKYGLLCTIRIRNLNSCQKNVYYLILQILILFKL